LLDCLETIAVDDTGSDRPFRMPVQWVNRPNLDFRGFSGTIAGGSVRPGDEVVVLPSARAAEVARIVTSDGDRDVAVEGEAVTLVLDQEIDISRGDVIAGPDRRPEVADQFAAHIVWMGDEPMLPGRQYVLRTGTASAAVQITAIKHRVNVNTLEEASAKQIAMNDVASCNLSLDRALPFDRYADNRTMGGFILIDRMTNATIGCGMIDHPLRRASNIHWQALKLDKAARAAANEQKPCVLWFTGLSGSGKSTVADLVEMQLHAMGRRTMLLDGDNVRHGLNRDLGFTDEDRVENIRRVAEVGKLMVDAGLITLVSLISPFRGERDMARGVLADGEFIEIFVDAPLSVCEARDPKGLYRKARAGELPNFTGIDSPYEPPENPELVLKSGEAGPESLADQVIALLRERGVI
jgi:bifunctional enzyme CysN/CysC